MMPTIRPAGSGEAAEAARRLGLPADVPADHLLVAVRGGRPVGAVFAEVTADGLAEVRPPAADDSADADALAVALMARLRAAGVAVAQCLLETGEPAPGPLLRVGFRHVTRLVTARRDPAPLDTASSILYIFPLSGDQPELLAAFAASLAGSRDLPELTGVRPPAVELAGYPATHRFLATLDGRPVGLSLLAPGEVLYLGLAPEARGRGFGTALLRHALAALGADAQSVTVATDARNRAARRLYDRHGFRPCRSQDVYLWLRTNSRP